jgi:protocatechuate 3,4-dioxygenase beta subunit
MMPTGGEMDTTPPKLIFTEPKNYSINFNEEGFELFFDEFVEVKDANENVVISPPLAKNPTYTSKGKSITVKFNSPLDSAATYVFNFNEAVVDFREGNPAKNLKYVFSTGNYLDSLTLQGTVIDAWTGKPFEKAIAMLYPNTIDSAAIEYRPFYVAKTNANGEYKFSFLRPDNYQLAIIKDENNNFKYDVFEEKIAFLDTAIALMPGSDTLVQTIAAFREIDSLQRVKDLKNKSRTNFELTLEKPAKNLKVFFVEPDTTQGLTPLDIEYLYPRRDSIFIWLPNFEEDLEDDFELILIDEDLAFADTLETFLPPQKKAGKKKDENKRVRALKVESTLANNFNYTDTLILSFSEPLVYFDSSAFSLFKDTLPQSFRIEPTGMNNRSFYIFSDWEEDCRYTFKGPDSSAVSIYGSVADSISFGAKSQRYSHFGSLTLIVEIPEGLIEGTPVLEIFDSKKKLFRRIVNPQLSPIEFSVINPDKFILKLIDDLNGNLKYDPGSYLKWVQPEKVYQYNQEIEVRSNWDLDVKWQLKKP